MQLSGTVFILSSIVLLSWPQVAFTVGGSGGCFDEQSPFLTAAAKGTAQEFEALAARIVETRYRRTLQAKLHWYSVKKQNIDRNGILHELIKKGPCNGQANALVRAVLAGNIEVTAWLLEQGADPNGSFPSTDRRYPYSTIFTQCEDEPNHTINYTDETIRMRRLEAYRMVIRKGGKIDAEVVGTIHYLLAGGGIEHISPMYICTDPKLLELFVHSGVTLKQSHLDYAIREALLWAPETESAKKKKGLLRAEFFLSNGLFPSKRTLKRLEMPQCGLGADFIETCMRLQALAGIAVK